MSAKKSEVEDRVKGLEHGADDYLTKPFSTEELILRVGGLLRRTKLAEAKQTIYAFKLLALLLTRPSTN